MSENKLSFVDLQRFLIKEMEMDANYQPIMINTLLNSPQRTATIDEIADKITELNPDSSINFRNIPVLQRLNKSTNSQQRRRQIYFKHTRIN